MKRNYQGLTPQQKYDILTKDFLERDGDTFVRVRQNGRLGWESTLPENGAYSAAILNPKTERDLYLNAVNLARQMIVSMNTPFRVNVRVSPDRSCTDGRTVYVATKVFDDPELDLGHKLDTFLGLTVHEGSHLLYTDFEALQDVNIVLVHKLQNIFEDERIERELGERKPGLANFLKATKYYYFDLYEKRQEKEQVPLNDATRLFNAILTMVRYPAKLSPDDAFRFADELLQVRDVLTPYPDSTKGCIKAAEKVNELLKKFLANPPKPQPQPEEEEDGDPQQGDRDEQGEDSGNNCEDAGEKQDKKQSGEPSGQESEESAEGDSGEEGKDTASGDPSDKGDDNESEDGNEAQGETGEDDETPSDEEEDPEGDTSPEASGDGEESDSAETGSESAEGDAGEGSESGEDTDADTAGSASTAAASGDPEGEDDATSSDSCSNSSGGQTGDEENTPDESGDAEGGKENDPLTDEEVEQVLQAIMDALGELSGHEERQPGDALDRDDVADALKDKDDVLAMECDGLLEIGHTPDTVIIKQNPNKPSYEASLTRVKKYIPAVSAALRSHGTSYTYNVTGTRSGLLDTNKLCEARQGVQNVYMRRGEVKADKLNVTLVIDESGSMYGIRERLARDTAVLVNEAVGNLRDVNLYIYGYTGGYSTAVLFPYREGKAPLNRHVIGSITNRDGTPTAKAMSEALWRIRQNNREKGIVLVISDGMADGGTQTVRQATDMLQKQGLEVIGISISSSLDRESLSRMYDHYIVMDRLDNLASELGKTVKAAILKLSKRTVS